MRRCQHCERRFVAGRRDAKTCSYACRNKLRIKLKREDLIGGVSEGLYMNEIARRLNVDEATARTAVRRHGLYSKWRQARY